MKQTVQKIITSALRVNTSIKQDWVFAFRPNTFSGTQPLYKQYLVVRNRTYLAARFQILPLLGSMCASQFAKEADLIENLTNKGFTEISLKDIKEDVTFGVAA